MFIDLSKPLYYLNFFLVFITLFLVNIGKLSAQNNTLERSGDVLLVILPASAVASTYFHKDKDGFWQFSKGFVLNAALTYGLKGIINKERPDLSNNNSFPSGHTSATFQSASFLQKRYGWKYGAPAYLLAGFTSFTRLNTKKHDGWDILGGVIIGIGSSYIFTTPYQQEHFQLTFQGEKNDYLIGLKYSF